MSVPDATVATRAVRPVLAGLLAAGEDPTPVLARVGLDPQRITDPDARIPHRIAIALWQAAVEVTGDGAFGLRVASYVDIAASFDVYGYIFLSSATVGEGLARMIRYHRINHDAAIIELVVEGGSATLRHRLPGGHVLPRAAAEFIVGGWTRAVRTATGLAWTPDAVTFVHRRPDDVAPHLELFGLEPVFDAGQNGLVFPAHFLDTSHVRADPNLTKVLVRHATDLLEKIPRADSLADRVRELLAAELRGGNPSAETIADALHLSVRTLSRRLADEGTSVKAQLDELRSSLAVRYLGDETISIAEVAFLLGFSEASAFHRAFKRWTGKTPSQFRGATP